MNNSQTELINSYNKVWKDCADRKDFNFVIDTRKTRRKAYYDVISQAIDRVNSPTVLELGCGTGIDINNIHKDHSSIKPFASDILPQSLRIGRRVSRLTDCHVNFFVADTLNLPIKSNHVDIVFSQGLIEHFKDPLKVIQEQARVIKKGGYLIINVPQKFTGYTMMKRKKMSRNDWDLGWETEFSYKDLVNYGNQLELAETGVCGYQYWKSWKEPAFIVKDLVDKVFRRLPPSLAQRISMVPQIYNTLITRVEKKWGHYFLQNIVIIFKK